jgi:hypothetical protein
MIKETHPSNPATPPTRCTALPPGPDPPAGAGAHAYRLRPRRAEPCYRSPARFHPELAFCGTVDVDPCPFPFPAHAAQAQTHSHALSRCHSAAPRLPEPEILALRVLLLPVGLHARAPQQAPPRRGACPDACPCSGQHLPPERRASDFFLPIVESKSIRKSQ